MRNSTVSTLTLINGAPGTGKSTIASLIAARQDMTLALDIDAIKHSLGHWERDSFASGVQARRLAVAMIRQHLTDGHDVVVDPLRVADDVAASLDEGGHAVQTLCAGRS